jgi:hypothetical protein
MATTTQNIALTKTAYVEVAAATTQGLLSNPHADDHIYIVYATTLPTATFLGHPIPPMKGYDFTLSPNPTDKIYARLADSSNREDGYIVITLGW